MIRRKIVHLSSVHRAMDTRILHKECRSLVEAGYDVTLIARAEQDTVEHGVTIRAVPSGEGNRLLRMTRTVFDVFRMALMERADAYHFHDAELIPAGLALKLAGKRVVYDVHENLPKLIRSKYWIPAPFRRPIAAIVGAVERFGSRWFDGIVAATPGIAETLPDRRTVIVQNYPLLSEFAVASPRPYSDRDAVVVYVGGLMAERGIPEMVESIGLVPERLGARLALAGEYLPESLRAEVSQLPGWQRVCDLGWLARPEVAALLIRSRIGLLVLHPVPNHLDSYPNKLFEYMAAGIPVVTSRFPFWEQFVKEPRTGLMVDEMDPQAIAHAITWLLDHPEEADAMGQRGRAAVEERFTWEREAEKLVDFYREQILA